MKNGTFIVKIDNKDVELLFKRPTQENLFDMDMKYRQVYSEAIRNEVITEAELKKRLNKTGAWTREDDNKIDHSGFIVADLERQLKERKGSQKSNLELAQKLGEARGELIGLIGLKTEMMSNTAEGIANDQRMHKFAELCCYKKKEDERFFTDIDHYKNFVAEHPDELSEIYKQGWLFDYKLPDNIVDEWEEIQYVKELAKQKEKKSKSKKTRGK